MCDQEDLPQTPKMKEREQSGGYQIRESVSKVRGQLGKVNEERGKVDEEAHDQTGKMNCEGH